ncbi:hypothetical protein [Aureimonas psammosilenae]|uniref:hypothetical protein n=1 Tax=Aureimonas psammosilenae TaxID=2495496 RepID=UPI0012609542|nr:hypothetical protein [Aureimonas psammosilenae]
MRRTLIALLPFFVMAGHASAADDRALSGPEIARMISGNTVQGAMAAGGPYREFYLPDGTLRGSNYDGRWSVVGDTLCFSYDAATPAQCWGARISRTGEISWIKNGIVDGTGVVQSGNPANF